MPQTALPFIDLQTQYRALQGRIAERMQAVLDHGQYIMGPEVAELEQALAARTGAKHCISVASGTEALLISLMALGIKPGDEVITTAFSFAATAEVIALLGAVPVFVDIEPDTCLIDGASVEAAITPRSRAIIPVSLYGQCADMAALNTLAARHGLAVIEDAAQSFGAHSQGRASCNLSTLACTSFFPSKPLGCYGDGGAIFTSDDALAEACCEIRVHGQSARYHHSRVGVGGRMDTLQCAIVLAKLERFDWEIAERKRLGDVYVAALRAQGITPIAVRAGRDCVWAQMTVLLEAPSGPCVGERDRIRQRLQAQGIPTAVHYPLPLNRQPAYAAYASAPTPHADFAAQRVLSLPMGPDLPAAELKRVVLALAQSLAEVSD